MVEALSGGRWQGSSTAEATATVTDPLTSDLGWVSNGTGNGYNASDYIDFKMVSPDASSGSDRDTVYIDLQDSDYLDGSNLATNFVVRCIVNFSDLTLASVNENRAYLGFYDTDAWGGTSQDMFALQIGCWTDSGAIRRLWTQGIDGGTFEGGSETKSQFTLVPAVDTDYYITWTKDGDTLKVRITTNSDYSGGEEQTVSKSGLAGLRYFGWKGRGDTQNNGGNTQGTIKPDIKIWNNATSTTSDEKDSLTNVPANTRYEETDTRKIYRRVAGNTTTSTLDSTNGVTDWTEAGSMYTIDSSDNQIDFALLRDNSGSSPTTALYDLGSGTMLSDTKFVLRFRLNVGTISNPSNSYSIQFNFGTFSSTSDMTTAEDAIGIFCQATGNTGNNWQFGVCDNAATYSQSPAVAFDASGTGVTGNNNWYVEIVREASDSGKCRLYSDSTYETLVQEKSLDFSSSNPQNLRYIGSKCYGSNSYATPTYNGYISDVKIQNGVDTFKEAGWIERNTA